MQQKQMARTWWILTDEVECTLGMEVMVMFNVSTDLDVTNGARGHRVVQWT